MRCFILCVQSTISLANLRMKASQRFNSASIFPTWPISLFP